MKMSFKHKSILTAIAGLSILPVGQAVADFTAAAQVDYSRELIVHRATQAVPTDNITYPAGMAYQVTDNAGNTLTSGSYTVSFTLTGGAEWVGQPDLTTPAGGDCFENNGAVAAVSGDPATVTYTFTIDEAAGLCPGGGAVADAQSILTFPAYTVDDANQNTLNGLDIDITAEVKDSTGTTNSVGATVGGLMTATFAISRNTANDNLGTATAASATIDVAVDRRSFTVADPTLQDDTTTIGWSFNNGLFDPVDGTTDLASQTGGETCPNAAAGAMANLGLNCFDSDIVVSSSSAAGVSNISYDAINLTADYPNNEFTGTLQGGSAFNANNDADVVISLFPTTSGNSVPQEPRNWSTDHTVHVTGFTNAVNTFSIVPTAVWDMNGTVLISTFGSGNAAYEQSFWLTNQSSVTGAVTARVYDMSGDDTTASAQIGADGAMGSLVGRSARGFQLSDVEAAIGASLANAVFWVEFTIEAENITGKNLLGTLTGVGPAVYSRTEMLRVGGATTGLPIED